MYVGHDPLRSGLSGESIIVAIVTVLALISCAVLGYQRRDLAA